MAFAVLALGQERIARPVFDLWQRLSPQDLSKSPVRLVWIDEASLKFVGPWPWPRAYLDRLTQILNGSGAKVVAFDVLFPEADRTNPQSFLALYPELTGRSAADVRALPSMDDAFGRSIGRGSVVLGRAGLDAPRLPKPLALALGAQFSSALPSSVRSWGQTVASIPPIDDSAKGYGLLNGDPDSDGVIRRVVMAGRMAQGDMPGLALEMARLGRGESRIAVDAGQKRLRGLALGALRIPVDLEGRMAVHFGHLPAGHQVSALDLLDGSVKPERLSRRYVIVALKGAGTADIVTTPLAANAYGAEVHASALASILADRMLERPRWAWVAEAGAAALLLAVALFLLPTMRSRGVWVLALSMVAILGGASFAAFRWGSWLVDPTGPTLVGAATGAAMIVGLFSQARHQRARLAQTLETERIDSARAAGELEAARAIQLGMLPAREMLSGFHARVSVDAIIEPAQSVGGDFFDAIAIDDRHVAFLVADVTGKGVPAALFMALSRALSKSVLLRDGFDLGAAMSRLNDEIARDNSEDMFVTMVAALLDTETGETQLCAAGHENPLLLRAGGVPVSLPIAGGPPLTVLPGFAYPVETVSLAPGDLIVFTTDGLSEALDETQQVFGADRIAAAVAACGKAGVVEICTALRDAVRRFENGAEATDDLTVLAFRYEGRAAI